MSRTPIKGDRSLEFVVLLWKQMNSPSLLKVAPSARPSPPRHSEEYLSEKHQVVIWSYMSKSPNLFAELGPRL